METLTNAANAASRAIFGAEETNTTGEEPVNGKLGDTSKGEPYDAGNTDSTNTELTNPETNIPKETSTANTTATSPTNTTDTSTTNTKTTDLPVREKEITVAEMMSQNNPTPKSDAPGNTVSTGPIQPEHEQDKTGVTDTPEPSTGFTSDKPTSSNETSFTGPEPSVSADPTSGVKNTQKQQGADRPEDEPTSDEHQRIKEAKKEAEEAQHVDVSGPGPVPLEERAKAGGATTSGGDDDGPQKESHGEGTGEKYVKSSGLKSDGGDFDAANPGAGKEADRLLEEKGVHHTTPGETAEEDSGSPGPSDSPASSGKKPSLKEKIKAKLHKH